MYVLNTVDEATAAAERVARWARGISDSAAGVKPNPPLTPEDAETVALKARAESEFYTTHNPETDTARAIAAIRADAEAAARNVRETAEMVLEHRLVSAEIQASAGAETDAELLKSALNRIAARYAPPRVTVNPTRAHQTLSAVIPTSAGIADTREKVITLWADGPNLTAASTNMFIMAVATSAPIGAADAPAYAPDPETARAAAIITVADAKTIITTLKALKVGDATITITPELVTVATINGTATYSTIRATYPPVCQIVSQCAPATDTVPEVAFNALYLSELAKAAHLAAPKSAAPAVLTVPSAKSPAFLTRAGVFTGVVMPVKM